jgi:hypothetical protein
MILRLGEDHIKIVITCVILRLDGELVENLCCTHLYSLNDGALNFKEGGGFLGK